MNPNSNLLLRAVDICSTVLIVFCVGTICVVGFGLFCRLLYEAWSFGYHSF